MRCKKVKESLTAFLDGELPGRLEERIQEHLAACPGCEAERKALERLRYAVEGMEAPPTDSSISAEAILERAGFYQREGRAVRKGGRRLAGRRVSPWSIIGWRPALALATGLAVIGLWRVYPFLRSLPVPTDAEIRFAERVDLFENLDLIRDLSLLEVLESEGDRDGEMS